VSQPINRYKADLRDVRFVLFEQFKLQEILGKAPYENWGQDEVNAVLGEVFVVQSRQHPFLVEEMLLERLMKLGRHPLQLLDIAVLAPDIRAFHRQGEDGLVLGVDLRLANI